MSVRAAITSSASVASMCYYWRYHRETELVWGWMVLCFPPMAVYVRRLRRGEDPNWRYRRDLEPVCYGAFDQFTFTLIAASASLTRLCRELEREGYYPMIAS